MNIQDFWVKEEDVPAVSLREVETMLDLRRRVAYGFYMLEKDKGCFPKNQSLSLPDGQDYARLLAFRVLEELSESLDSHDKAHRLEELIDAFNYLLNLILFDSYLMPIHDVARLMYPLVKIAVWDGGFLDHKELGRLTIELTGKFADTLRNRSWMNNSQALSYQGISVLKETFVSVALAILAEFESWEEFYQYYMAKNQVLKFRIDSKY